MYSIKLVYTMNIIIYLFLADYSTPLVYEYDIFNK